MDFTVGDKVKFLNNVGGGKITSVVDKKTVNILTDDGWEIPVLVNDLIKDSGGFGGYKSTLEEEAASGSNVQSSEFEEEYNEEEEEEETYEKDTDEIGLYFAFVPQVENLLITSDLDVFLINDSNYNIFYHIVATDSQHFESFAGKLEANTKIQVKTYQRQQLNTIHSFLFQFLFFKKGKHDIKKPLEKSVKINNTRFFKEKHYKENDFFDERAQVYTIYSEDFMAEEIERLTKSDVAKIIQNKEVENKRINQPKQYKKNDNPANQVEEVDLHIHELVDDHSKLSNKEILDIQMTHFSASLKSAIKHRIKAIVFIHGVGNGTLKLELRRKLEKEYSHLLYQDASFREYGYGATMVMTSLSRKTKLTDE